MDIMLETKDVYKIPEGLPELCADISREVLRVQSFDLFSFIADYVNALLITRENMKVAIKLVDHVLQGSEAIISILSCHGFSFEKIAAVAPLLQTAFREYLDSQNTPCDECCQGGSEDEISENLIENTLKGCNTEYLNSQDVPCDECCQGGSEDENSENSIHNTVKECDTSLEREDNAAKIIQLAFRKHYENMLFKESRGEIQWQRAVVKTMNILRKAGVTQTEINQSAPVIMVHYQTLRKI